MPARTEIDVEATPEEVWEHVSTEEGREGWLHPDEAADVWVETVEAPHRLVWWWGEGRVELDVVARPDGGSRVVVTESRPAFPVTALATACAGVRA
jgi:hypothetical protein